jgi:hypothetical protein
MAHYSLYAYQKLDPTLCEKSAKHGNGLFIMMECIAFSLAQIKM